MPDATAMAVRDGVIAWLGTDAVGRDQFPEADIVDLDGAFVAPAFVDSHVHVTATGLSLTGLDLRAATSRRQCVDLIAAYARSHPEGVLWAHGWDESGWPEPTPPTVEEVDAAVGPDRMAYLARVDAHSAIASTALQRAAGVSGRGPLTADEHHRVRRVAREHLTVAQRDAARRAALDLAASRGIVAVHECAGPEIGGLDDWRELRAMSHGVDVIGYWGEAVDSADAARALIAETGAAGLAGDLFVDGALGSRTAWLHEPYSDAPRGCAALYGNTYLTTDAITAHLMACTEGGITAGFHVIGDAAVTAVVEALGAVVDELGSVAVARCGHRLEHVEMVTEEQAAQLGRWGVIASLQPAFDALWGGDDGMYAQRVGRSRASGMNNFALLASQGVPLAFGSDSPVTDMDPWLAVRAATTHRTPGSAVSARAAFAAATRGAWRAGGVRDGVTGTLVPGAPASYAVWDADEFDVAAPADAVQRWSTDPRSRVPVLPRLDGPAPRCRQTVHRGTILHGSPHD
ncbi:amidohydrolase family protein [Mycolicibacterium sp. 018/SC-01/001]|uniref:amidohydrolase n=1 Tax=Mycolicibacterium sp. 018/SC-01/001 TaxID=2592069 RepID=UPI00117CA414|nr:amidohydrolase family protein [Mycolicibacterium sp. 018/SC-01/001]TRW79031.1 amidohydrolase family protein [Mycolicibacterium sp. 018/SC-01/001]